LSIGLVVLCWREEIMDRKEKRDRKNANHRRNEKRRGVVKSIKRFTAAGGAKRLREFESDETIDCRDYPV